MSEGRLRLLLGDEVSAVWNFDHAHIGGVAFEGILRYAPDGTGRSRHWDNARCSVRSDRRSGFSLKPCPIIS